MPAANENVERYKVHRLPWIVATVNMLVNPPQQTFMILQTLRTQMSLSQCYNVAVDAVPSRTQHTASCNAEQGKVPKPEQGNGIPAETDVLAGSTA